MHADPPKKLRSLFASPPLLTWMRWMRLTFSICGCQARTLSKIIKKIEQKKKNDNGVDEQMYSVGKKGDEQQRERARPHQRQRF